MDIPQTGDYVRSYLSDGGDTVLFFLADPGATTYLVYQHPSEPTRYVSREELIAEGKRLGLTRIRTPGGNGQTVLWSGK